MTELTGVTIPNILEEEEEEYSGDLPEKLRTFRRTCQYIFDGTLAEKDEKIKVQYLMLSASLQNYTCIPRTMDLNTGEIDDNRSVQKL